MLKFKQFLSKRRLISRLRNLIRFGYNYKRRNLGLLINNQEINNYIPNEAICVNSLKKNIKTLTKQSAKFLTTDEISTILSNKKNDSKFTSKEIVLTLKELEKSREIYLYKSPVLSIELWGTANLLDRNLIPLEDCITDQNCRAKVNSYKIQNHLQ